MPLTCPSESAILLFVLAEDAARDRVIAQHLTGCVSCQARVAEVNRLVRAIESSASHRVAGKDECLDEPAMAALIEGRANPDHQAQVAHLAECGHCRSELASLAELLAQPEVAAEVLPLSLDRRSASQRRLLAGIGVIGAAAMLLLLVWPGNRTAPIGEHRGPTITAAAVPTPVSPIGDVTEARTLTWSAVAGADRYRVTLFAATGGVLFEAQITDTVTALPDSIIIAPGRLYLWKVEAGTSLDRWTASDLIEFRVGSDTVRQLPLSPTRDSLRLLAQRLSDSALAAEIRARPLEVRDALSQALALSVRGQPAAREAALGVARRLAVAYQSAWHDPFLVREVARFTGWPPERRAAKVQADSLRRAGLNAFGRDGAAAAIAIWRRALIGATAIEDTAGVAAILGNIGAGLSQDGHPDSAETSLERSRLLAVAVGDLRVEANAISELAGVLEHRNDTTGARQYYSRAIALRSRIGDSRGLASDYNNLAGLARAGGNLDEARSQLEAALAINRRDGRAEVAATNLINLAALAALTGDFARSEAMYREAAATWRTREEWADLADAMRGLGELQLRRGDYPAARTDLLEALTLYDRTGPLTDALAVRQELAGVRAAAGDLQGALDQLRHAQHLADSAGVERGVAARITLARADLASQLNARPQAERLYASAEQQYRRAGDRAGEAEAKQGRGIQFLAQGNPTRARELFDAALRTEVETSDRRAAALTRLWLGELSLSVGDSAAGRDWLTQASVELERLGDPVAAAAALGERGAVEAAAKLPAAAESLYRVALSRVGERQAPEVTWRLHAGLGAARRDRGALDEAGRQLRLGIADIERAGRSLMLPERRSSFLTDKWDVYVDLAMLEQERGRVAAAFEVSERLRAGEMLDLLSQGRIAAPSDTAADLVTREQDLRHRIGELTRGLEGGGPGVQLVRGPDVSTSAAGTRDALLRAQESYTDLLLEMRERVPQHVALVSPGTATWRELAGQLQGDQAFIEYLVSDASSLAFVVTRDTTVAVRLEVNRHDLARQIEFLRGTLQPRGSAALDSLWRAPLRQLYRDLIAPIESTGLLTGKTRLTLVPHAELHYLPFAALLGQARPERFLVQRYQLTITPSASVWLALGARPRTRGAGVLAFAPRPVALPASRQEVAAIARLGGEDALVVVGSGATESAFRREAPTRRIIHLATYGVLNKQNPLFSFIELAPGGTEDGRLEVHEVFGLRLAAELVVLSACQTGLGSGALTDVPAGDDWIGLARAFLSAGASRVMATLWPVQDRASAALMEQFYREYASGVDPAEALAAAQRTLLATPGTSNPYYWAGFELVSGR